jgi:hypothetical protein
MDKRKVILGVILLVFVGLVGGVLKLGKENKSLKVEIAGLKANPQDTATQETKDLIAKVGKLVMLPTDEEPVLATVTDKEKLNDQPLFAKAENGDKILIYAKAQKAYIYNPAKDVLVDVVPVNIGTSQQTAITGVDVNNPLKVVLVNGTKTVGVTNTLEQRIKDNNIAGITVVAKTTAKMTNYQNTLVLDLTGKWATQAAQFAGLVGGKVATESAEIKPTDADLMVILGADFK